MANISIEGARIHLDVEGIDQLWALRSATIDRAIKAAT